ncbi:MAG: S8 family peptidase, partial [Gammaproteobacteria bacterium]
AARFGVAFKPLRKLATGAQLYRVSGASKPDLAGIARAIAANPNVAYAEPDRVMHAMMTPNDTRYSEQWDFYEATGGLDVESAWDTTDGSGAIVGVIDTGYRPHADLVANILPGADMITDTSISNDGDGRDMDAKDPGDWITAGECGNGQPTQDRNSSWHGTHVSGTIAAVTNNGNGVAGVAYGAKIVPVRVLGKCGGMTSDIADAMIWAAGGSVSGVSDNANPVNVISMSLGGSGACDQTTQDAINYARNHGVTVVVAAGNENQDASNSNPANCNGVVAVAATNRSGGRAYYSNYGSIVDVAAPGGELTQSSSTDGILSTLNTGTTTPGSDTYAYYQGTSMATPHVSGVAALIYSVDPSATPDDVENILKNTARSFPSSCSGCGTGIVDAAAAVASASGGGGGGGGGTGGNTLTNGTPVTGLSASTGGDVTYTMDVPSGASNLSFAISGGTGDADLYVKFGSAPTTSSYDCRPYLTGNNETCNISNVQAGTYYVMVHAYQSFSGVSLVGSYDTGTGGGGGTGGACPSGYTEYTGSLSGSGASNYEPNGNYYQTTSSGTHSGILTGPSGTDFDLYLQKWNGSSWSTVDKSISNTSNEQVDYSGASGYYVWKVKSYSGSGSYTFCLSHP